ncbi:MAG: RAMP superfamily CRISPR-associated protein [Chloroflexota bacterium]|nr:RAMP superfamily CRISPR-associated protein [Chloroflexota bacterium]
MNPYDFVPIDTEHPPERRRPVWHHALKSAATPASRLFSGHLYVTIKAETPLFIPDTEAPMQDPNNPAEHIYNNAGKYIIPGSSLKGLLRNVVETLCSGCLRMLHLPPGYEERSIPSGFMGCQDNRNLCVACRIFGMMSEGQRNAQVFLGKINIGDALANKESLAIHGPIYTAILEGPKPRHQAFYLDADKRYIAGRKFYFHHHGRLTTADRLLQIRNEPGRYRNQHIEPIDTGTEFNACIDFTNLEADELAALLLAITLKPDMRHKIGYGKPIGLGSVRMTLAELRLVDYATRYTAFRSGRGISSYNADELTNLVHDQMASFDEQVNAAWRRFYGQPALDHLHSIWGWQPDSLVVYSYPNRDWFEAHSQARIADTWDL